MMPSEQVMLTLFETGKRTVALLRRKKEATRARGARRANHRMEGSEMAQSLSKLGV